MIYRYYPFQCSAGLIEISLSLSGPELDVNDEHVIDHCFVPTLTMVPPLFCTLEALRPLDATDGSTLVPTKIKQNIHGVELELDTNVTLNFHIDDDSEVLEDVQALLRGIANQFYEAFAAEAGGQIKANFNSVVLDIMQRRMGGGRFANGGTAYDMANANNPFSAAAMAKFASRFGDAFNDFDFGPDFTADGQGLMENAGFRQVLEQLTRELGADGVSVEVMELSPADISALFGEDGPGAGGFHVINFGTPDPFGRFGDYPNGSAG